MSVTLDCAKLTTREINTSIKRLALEGETEIHLVNPEARHSLGVAVFDPIKIVVEGTAGYFCGAMNDGATFHILGNTGWSVGECMLSGEIVVERNAASGTGASIRGGLYDRLHDAARHDDYLRRCSRRPGRLDVRWYYLPGRRAQPVGQ